MEQSVDLVAQKCGSQLNDYQRCILANRANADGGAQACQVQRQQLTKCASDAVPLLSQVKQRCQTQIRTYDACLSAGQNDTDEQLTQRCAPALRALWQCTEAVRKEDSIKAENANQTKTNLRPV